MLCDYKESPPIQPVRCITNLVGYLGEHLSQTFYNCMVICDIQYGTESLPPICISTGQPTPIDLSECYGVPACDPCIVLCVPVHCFKRVERVPPYKAGTYCPLDQPSSTLTGVQCSVVERDKPSRLDTTQLGVDKGDTSRGKHVALVTLLVYYPVGFMKSANDLLILTEQNKNIHLPPHEHEFVAYPKMITLPIEEVGGRIVWGMMYSQKLRSNALTLSQEFLFACLGNRSNSKPFTHKEEEDVEAATSPASTQFTIASRELYIRLCVIRRLQREGVNPIELSKLTLPTDRLWYSKVLTQKTRLASSNTDSPPSTKHADFFVGESPEDVGTKPHTALFDWIGFKLRNSASQKISVRSIAEPGVEQTPSGGICVVFVRRESYDCGKAICESMRTTNFLPAKLRRTRVRGTVQSGIKLKRRFSDVDLSVHTLDPIKLQPEKRILPESLDPLGLQTTSKLEYSVLYSDSLPWMRSRSPPPCNNGPLSPNSLLHSSIAIRVKRGAYLCHRSAGLKENRGIRNQVITDQSDLLESDRAVTYQTRNRVPPKRYDLAEQDLELALQRSLNDKTPKDRGSRQRKPRNGMNSTLGVTSNNVMRMKSNDISVKHRQLGTAARRRRKSTQRYVQKLGSRAVKHQIASHVRHTVGSTKKAIRKAHSFEPIVNQDEDRVVLQRHPEVDWRNAIKPRVTLEHLYKVLSDPTGVPELADPRGQCQESNHDKVDKQKNLPKLTLLKDEDGDFTIRQGSSNSLRPPENLMIVRTSEVTVEDRPREFNSLNTEPLQHPFLQPPSFRLENYTQSLSDFSYPLNLSISEQSPSGRPTDPNCLNQAGRTLQTSNSCSATLSFVHHSTYMNSFQPILQCQSPEAWSAPMVLPQENPTDLGGKCETHIQAKPIEGSNAPLTMWTKLQHPLPAPEFRLLQTVHPEVMSDYTTGSATAHAIRPVHPIHTPTPYPIQSLNHAPEHFCSLNTAPSVTMFSNPSQPIAPGICMTDQVGQSTPTVNTKFSPYTQFVQNAFVSTSSMALNMVPQMNQQSDSFLWSTVPQSLVENHVVDVTCDSLSLPTNTQSHVTPTTSTAYWNLLNRNVSIDFCPPVTTFLHTPSVVQNNLSSIFFPSIPSNENTTDYCKNLYYVPPTVNQLSAPFVNQFQPMNLLPYCENSTPLAVFPVPCPLQFIT